MIQAGVTSLDWQYELYSHHLFQHIFIEQSGYVCRQPDPREDLWSFSSS